MSLGEVQIWGPLGPQGNAIPMMVAGVSPQRIASAQSRLVQKRQMLLGSINWAKSGPSQAPMRLFGLGAANDDLAAQFAQLEITDGQVWDELAWATQQGASDADMAAYQAQYDMLLDRMLDAQEKLGQVGDDDAALLAGQMTSLQTDYNAFLKLLQTDRQKREFGMTAGGLAWGIGAAAVAATVLYVTWKNRKRKR